MGRPQTDADLQRVVESMSQSGGSAAKSVAGLANLVKKLQNRWFLVRDLRSKNDLVLLRPSWAMSYLRDR